MMFPPSIMFAASVRSSYKCCMKPQAALIAIVLSVGIPASAVAQESRALPPGASVSPQVAPSDLPVRPQIRPYPEDSTSPGGVFDDSLGDRIVSDDQTPDDSARVAGHPRRRVGGALGVTVANTIALTPGRVLVDVAARRLYYAVDASHLRSYPVAVGKSGAQWRGSVTVGRMAVGPGWHPTAHQRRVRHLPGYVAPGRSNPLGVRAIYLFRSGRDTLLRIHGTNEPASIGHAVSSGCIRMRNEDVVDLYSRVSVGTVVTAR